MSLNDPFAANIAGVNDLVGSKTNKSSIGISSSSEGIEGEKKDYFDLQMSEVELLMLAKRWDEDYRTYESKIKPRQKECEKAYLGRLKQGTPQDIGDNIAGNFIFEAEETFLAAALAKNPEPVVWSDNTEQGNSISDAVKTMLQYHADTLNLRAKLALVTRKWSMDLLGVIKLGWDLETSDVKFEVRDVKNFVFDPNGYVDTNGHFVGYLGEKITVPAEQVADMFPEHKRFISDVVDGKMGTRITYTEWWTDDYSFITFKDKVLAKNKNPHFNYDTDVVAEEGEEPETVEGKNHFHKPLKPYVFLSVFSLQTQPHDLTGLIEQNIPNQRLIINRIEQIDFNIRRANNAILFSGDNFTQETAKQGMNGIAKGHGIWVPPGKSIDQAVRILEAPSLSQAHFKDLENNIENLRSSFGVVGITAAGQDDEETARGMILKQQFDNTRIGGGIGDKIEGVADAIFNFLVQMYYVYYDEPHYAAVMGQMRASQFVIFSSQNLATKLVVSVAPNSMKAKDEISEMNEAISLYEMQALDPKTLLTRLNYPDPDKTAAMASLWAVDKAAYLRLNFPEIAQMLQPPQSMGAPAQMGGGAPEQGGGNPSLSVPPASAALSNVPLPA